MWTFGAGTHLNWRHGPALGVLAERYLRKLSPSSVTVFSNQADQNYFGTHEEMKWGVMTVQKQFPSGTVTFVFFGPWWHLLRARVIWQLFFKSKWGQAKFVATTDGAVPNLRHEFLGYLKILGHWLFPRWIKTRDQTPYPVVVERYGIEC